MRRTSITVQLVIALALASQLVAVPADAATPTCLGKPATMVFGDRANIVSGTAGNDVVVLGGGDDQFYGGDGHDRICAGPGSDYISTSGSDRTLIDLGPGDDGSEVWSPGWVKGGPGNDRIAVGYSAVAYGGPGRDDLAAEIGTPRLFGGVGDDHLMVGLARPTVDGGAGTDTVGFWFEDEPVSVDLARKRAVNKTYGVIRIHRVENVTGTEFADVLRGDRRANRLEGNGGADVINGRGGHDVARGGRGHDRCRAEVRVSC